ncbi:hypothetical protein IJ670_02620 [bacterium]|nr:hypothetical protein [bacterium]
MTVIKFKNFTKISEEEKRLVLEWRNSDRVRQKMANTEIISLENHLKFVESLKTRKDCRYYLFCVDDVPVGVYDIVDIKEDGSGGVGGSYIGDTNYLGYGLLISFIINDKFFKHSKTNTKFYVMKNNKRTFLMHKNIFGAEIDSEDEKQWNLFITPESWNKRRDYLLETIYKPLNISDVIWED